MPERPSFNPEAAPDLERNETLRQAWEHLASAVDQLQPLTDTEDVRAIVGVAADLLDQQRMAPTADHEHFKQGAATELITLVNRLDPRRRIPYRVGEINPSDVRDPDA